MLKSNEENLRSSMEDLVDKLKLLIPASLLINHRSGLMTEQMLHSMKSEMGSALEQYHDACLQTGYEPFVRVVNPLDQKEMWCLVYAYGSTEENEATDGMERFYGWHSDVQPTEEDLEQLKTLSRLGTNSIGASTSETVYH